MARNKKTKTDIAVVNHIKNELDVQKNLEHFKVTLTDVFSNTSIADYSSFNNSTIKDNIEKVDNALTKTQELNSIWDRAHTQWTWKHLNLSFHDPMRNVKQVLAEINNKKTALNEMKWRFVQIELSFAEINDKLSKPELLKDKWEEIRLNIELAQLKESLTNHIVLIDGAMKDILSLTDLYEQLKSKVNNFNEDDVEENETLSHLRRSLVQCIRDVRERGSITKGEQEYMEQIGVNPMKIQKDIREYVMQEENSDDYSTNGLFNFVEDTVNKLKHVYKVDEKRMDMIGLSNNHNPEYSNKRKVAITETKNTLPKFKFTHNK